MILIKVMAHIYKRPVPEFVNLLARKETVRYVRALCKDHTLNPN